MKEMESLNIDDLDVEELERRLEMAPTGPSGPVPTCDPDICGADIIINCDRNCTGDMSWRC